MTVVSRVAKKSRTCNHNCELFTQTINSQQYDYFLPIYSVLYCQQVYQRWQ